MTQARLGVAFFTCTVFVGVNLLAEELLGVETHPRDAGPSLAGLRSQPSAKVFKGEYALQMNGSTVLRGVARMTIGAQPTSALALELSSISLRLVGAGHPPDAMGGLWRLLGLGGGEQPDVDLLLRGVDLQRQKRVVAFGLSDPAESPRFGSQPCRLDAVLDGAEPPVKAAAVGRGLSGFVGEVNSPDCGFSLRLSTSIIDVKHIGYQVMHYAVWANLLTCIQIWCFVAQMRHIEEDLSAAKLSIVCVAIQALMDAYDSFLHLSISASTQYMFNTFAIVSLLKFVLFALVEVPFLLVIWRHRNRDVFAEGWDAVRRELSRVYSYFYGALIGGILFLFNATEYLDVIVVLFQAYWVPQILHDVRLGCKGALRLRFLLCVSATRCLALLYLWGCPAGIFSGDIYPELVRSPSPGLCIAVLLMQGAQVTVMALQQVLGPRWFVPWAFLPHVYNYLRPVELQPGSECVICMSDISPEDGQRVAVTPCDHRFHGSCLERWMDVKMECPTCRGPLPPMF